MRLFVLLLFLALVLCGGFLVKPVYIEYIEIDLTRQTHQLLDEKDWRGIQISYDHLSPVASGTSVLNRSKVIRAIDRNIWGAYVDPRSIKASTLSPAKLNLSINRQSKLVILSGTVPNRDIRRIIQQAAAVSNLAPEVDNILLVDDRLPSPSWEGPAPAFITKFINTNGTTGFTLSDADGLILEGQVDLKQTKEDLGKAGASFSKVKNLLQVSDSN